MLIRGGATVEEGTFESYSSSGFSQPRIFDNIQMQDWDIVEVWIEGGWQYPYDRCVGFVGVRMFDDDHKTTLGAEMIVNNANITSGYACFFYLTPSDYAMGNGNGHDKWCPNGTYYYRAIKF